MRNICETVKVLIHGVRTVIAYDVEEYICTPRQNISVPLHKFPFAGYLICIDIQILFRNLSILLGT